MKNLFKKNWVWLFLSLSIFALLAGLWGYVYITADPPGYCREQKRYISDEEFVELAVREAFKDQRINIDGSDDSIKGFRAKHQNCCLVNGREDATIFNRTFHLQRVTVHFVFERKPEDISKYDSNDKYYESYVVFNICGIVLENYGITTSIKEIAN